MHGAMPVRGDGRAYNGGMRRVTRAGVMATAAVAWAVLAATAQTPAPATRPAQPAPVPGAAAAPAQAAPNDGRPSDTDLWGVPVYPSAVFLRSYDAGRGQRYYIFGSTVPFGEMVAYYRNVTKDKGNLVFEVPPTHVFEIARYREETMAFPPTITVKDYTFSGSAGYPNPKPGAQPERFPTLIQIVPPPPGTQK